MKSARTTANGVRLEISGMASIVTISIATALGSEGRNVFFASFVISQRSLGLSGLQADSAASVSASTSAPRAMSSGDAYSSGRWLYPLRQGMNNMAVGAIRDMKSES